MFPSQLCFVHLYTVQWFSIYLYVISIDIAETQWISTLGYYIIIRGLNICKLSKSSPLSVPPFKRLTNRQFRASLAPLIRRAASASAGRAMITMLVIDGVSWWNIDADRTAGRRGPGPQRWNTNARRMRGYALAADDDDGQISSQLHTVRWQRPPVLEIHYGKIISTAFRRALRMRHLSSDLVFEESTTWPVVFDASTLGRVCSVVLGATSIGPRYFDVLSRVYTRFV